MERHCFGWDVGGAHLKSARVDAAGMVTAVRQIPCPLWQGLERLEAAVDEALEPIDAGALAGAAHALTMTGELVDLFEDRGAGVRAIVARLGARLGTGRLRVFAAGGGFVSPAAAAAAPASVASANWHASAALAARAGDGLLVDIGSTTTDIVGVRGGQVRAAGSSDSERLRSGELVYTGVVRTPVAAVVRAVPDAGAWCPVTAELFATLGDVHVLCGDLELDARYVASADGRGWDAGSCARRLARMIGCDAGAGECARWRALARFIAHEHEDACRAAIERRLSALQGSAHPRLIGAGCGRFLVRRIAARLQCPYLDFAACVPAAPGLEAAVAECAPAVAVARLLREEGPR